MGEMVIGVLAKIEFRQSSYGDFLEYGGYLSPTLNLEVIIPGEE